MPEHPGLAGDSQEIQIGPDVPNHMLVLDLRNGTQEKSLLGRDLPCVPILGLGCEQSPHQLCS